jgi:GR25 family glycosyltransferase involved in LPS biosynthesis
MIKLFDRTVMINLAERPDRLLHGSAMLSAWGVEFERITGIKKENGQDGIYETLMSLFRECVDCGTKTLLVFEDDVHILEEDFNEILKSAVSHLPVGWHMLYLGANLPKIDLVEMFATHLLKTKRALSLHAVAYSYECMKMILALPKQLPVDLQIASFIHPLGMTFTTFPLLCGQTPGYSDIEKKYTNYRGYIQDRYKLVIDHLNINRNEQKSSQSLA